MKNKVVIIGANGQLGHDLIDVFSDWDIVALNGPPEKGINISDKKNVERVFKNISAEYIINTAAFTNVPECEKRKELAYSVNTLGAYNVALMCKNRGFKLVHISTDYVFDGEKNTPYTEDDRPNPLNYYGYTKLEAEKAILELQCSYYILRTSGLYGKAGCLLKGGNFVDKMLNFAKEGKKISVVEDEILTPTSSLQLAKQIKKMCEANVPSGIYHATNQGECSWYDFTKEIFNITGLEGDIIPVKQKDLQSSVIRPHYSVLENRNLREQGIDIMDDWKCALKEYLMFVRKE